MVLERMLTDATYSVHIPVLYPVVFMLVLPPQHAVSMGIHTSTSRKRRYAKECTI